MLHKTEKFVSIIKNIALEKCSFGNQLLYDMCVEKIGQQWDDYYILADKIWLIGRSYAASPERRYTYKSECSDEEKKNDNAGDGTGEYFKKIAENILKNVAKANNTITILENNYYFDFSDRDCEILFTGINGVLQFNKLIVSASKNYDGDDFTNKVNYKNQISFCSKFLHFHFPDTIFIIDSLSKMGASYMFSKGTRTNAEIKWQTDRVSILNESSPKGATNILFEYEPYIANNKNFEKEFTKKLKESKLDLHGIEYAQHCLRAYKTACLFKMYLGKNVPSCSYPRIVDTLLLKIKSIK